MGPSFNIGGKTGHDFTSLDKQTIWSKLQRVASRGSVMGLVPSQEELLEGWSNSGDCFVSVLQCSIQWWCASHVWWFLKVIFPGHHFDKNQMDGIMMILLAVIENPSRESPMQALDFFFTQIQYDILYNQKWSRSSTRFHDLTAQPRCIHDTITHRLLFC